jgi:hypothetical protein
VPFKILLSEKILIPNTATSKKIALAAETQLAEGQFVFEEDTLNKEKSPICRALPRRTTFCKREGQN